MHLTFKLLVVPFLFWILNIGSCFAWTPSLLSLRSTLLQQKKGMRFSSSSSSTSIRRMATSLSTTATSTTATTTTSFRESVQSRLVNSWIEQLNPETKENLERSRKYAHLSKDDTNQTKRPVYNGHYVLVPPNPLPNPKLVLYSSNVAKELLGFTNEQLEDNENNNMNDFINYVSGNLLLSDTWATPYALSIMGTRYTNNCPYGTGDGYGDGRAISIGEISNNDNNKSYELQLKGGGTTPFHRGADGRAVLRSSIREFLASEAMYYLGVETTRALSLVVSDTLKIQRPWYREALADNTLLPFQNNNNDKKLPDIDDPRLGEYTVDQRRQILQQLRRSKADPNIMITEPAAITCRVAPSFMRIGHVDLFARRVEKASMMVNSVIDDNNDKSTTKYCTTCNEWKELVDIIWHACYREYKNIAYDPYFEQKDIATAATVFLNHAAINIATMVANWIRVGFIQGNFNADNCLVGGRTMDYGPFGFKDEYDALAAKWTGSGQHFGFLNQPNAGFVNYGVLVQSVVPVIAVNNPDKDEDDIINELMERASKIFEEKVNEVFRIKLGFEHDHDVADDLWENLEPIMRISRVDWTLFFRELTYLVRDVPNLLDSDVDIEYDNLLNQLIGDDNKRDGSSPFYEPVPSDLRDKWKIWLEQWRDCLAATFDNKNDIDIIYDRMRKSNPKYILREWMLVKAYQDAEKNENLNELHALYELIQRPYDEGSDIEISNYYRRAPDHALLAEGTAFMS